MTIYEHIRLSRVYSYIMTALSVYGLAECLNWIYSIDLSTVTNQGAAIATAVLTALVALVKFTYTFASTNPEKTTNNVIYEDKEKT